MKRIVICTSLVFFLSSFAQSQPSVTTNNLVNTDNPPVNHATPQQTQDVSETPEKRIEIIRVNPKSKKVDEQIKELVGQTSENRLRTTADFLPYILQMGQGDPTKMAEFLTKAARDPSLFANNLATHLKQKTTVPLQKAKPLPQKFSP